VKATDASYLAGFMDGDGSIHFQLVRQDGYRFGFYIRVSLSLSQSTSDREGLELLQGLIGAGYLRDRGTGMSDLVITSRPILMRILSEVEPFVIFKRRQVRKALEIMGRIKRGLDPNEFLELAREVDAFSALNHSKTKRIFAADVERHMQGMGVLVPVTTSPMTLFGEMETPINN
jgi:LAGLIDADG endonuclease